MVVPSSPFSTFETKRNPLSYQQFPKTSPKPSPDALALEPNIWVDVHLHRGSPMSLMAAWASGTWESRLSAASSHTLPFFTSPAFAYAMAK